MRELEKLFFALCWSSASRCLAYSLIQGFTTSGNRRCIFERFTSGGAASVSTFHPQRILGERRLQLPHLPLLLLLLVLRLLLLLLLVLRLLLPFQFHTYVE